jgi:hypothetical protein
MMNLKNAKRVVALRFFPDRQVDRKPRFVGGVKGHDIK